MPIEGAVDRRNAPMLQIILLLLVTLPPLTWAYRIFLSALPWRPGESASLVMSLVTSTVAASCFVLIRRGRFRLATRVLLAVVVVLMLLSYADSGFAAQGYERPVQAVWIVMAGLIMGRRALWWTYASLVLAFAIGVGVDLASGKVSDAWRDQVMFAAVAAIIFLLIAVVVDRSVAALRESLAEAQRRGDELAIANHALEAEIAERERIREQLVHAQKVEAVGRLASGVAHDFNHLLGLMLGHAQRARTIEHESGLRDALAGVESAVHRAAAVARTLLNFSRRDTTRIETFDAGEALREMRPMLQQAFDSGVRFSMDIADGVHPVEFDRAQFVLVALNIAANASDAMPEGGDFRMTLRRPSEADIILEFMDTGHGISADLQPRVFEPFFTTKPSGQGTGLGLAVAADLVANARGTLDVSSAPGRGSTFRLSLPVAGRASDRVGGTDEPEV